MSQWRDAMRRAYGGSTQPGTWVPTRYADFLKEVIVRLSELGSIGDEYRSIAHSWLSRRRPVRDRYAGVRFSLEIDGPSVGTYWYMLPMGGRITGVFETWVELTPEEAEEIHTLVRRSVDDTLDAWLQTKGLLGHIRDHTGVATEVIWTDPSYPQSDYSSIARPGSEEEFRANEVRIAREIEREAYRRRRHPTDDPTIEYYEGFWGSPSRCHIIHRESEGTVLFALGHVKDGGTSPTNMFEKLATLLRRKYYPKVSPDKFKWYDVWLDLPYDGQRRVRSVELTWDGRAYGNPSWGDDLPPTDFQAEIDRVYKQAAEYELDAYQAQHREYRFRLPKAFREICGPFQNDYIHETPRFEVVAHLHAHPGGSPSAGDPCLLISDISTPIHSALNREKVRQAAEHIPLLRRVLDLEQRSYDWGDPEFRELCTEFGLDVEAARAKLAPHRRSGRN